MLAHDFSIMSQDLELLLEGRLLTSSESRSAGRALHWEGERENPHTYTINKKNKCWQLRILVGNIVHTFVNNIYLMKIQNTSESKHKIRDIFSII